MERNDFKEAFDGIAFSDDFNEETKRLLRQKLEEKGENTVMKQSYFAKKSTRALLIAAALAVVFAATVGAVVHFTMPKTARDFLQLEDSRLAQILADGSVEGVDGVRIEKDSVKTAGQTVSMEAVLDGTAIRPDIAALLNVVNNRGDASSLTFTAKKEYWAVLTVSADDGGPVLGCADESELHGKLGCALFIQGIEPIVWHYDGQFIIVDDVAYLFVPLHDAVMYADRELRVCVYGDFAPALNIMAMNEADGLPRFNDDYDGLQAAFTVDFDDDLADHHAVAVFEEKQPFLPSEWEKAHGLAS